MLRKHQVAAVIVFAVAGLLGEAHVAAKPHIRVSVVFESAAEEFWKTIDGELPAITPRPTEAEAKARATKLIRDALVDTLGKLQMFAFDDDPTTPHTLTLTIKTNPNNPWPCRPAIGWITTSFPGPNEIAVELAPGESASSSSYFNAGRLAEADHYTERFKAMLQTWPEGFLQGVMLTDKAGYRNGNVTLPLSLVELGHTQPRPSAYFEVRFETVNRHFVLCRSTPNGSEGDDRTGALERYCTRPRRAQSSIPAASLGAVYLLRGFL